MALLVSGIMQPVLLSAQTAIGLVDVPNRRSSHTTPVPRGGGVAVMSAVAVATLVNPYSSPVSFAILAAVLAFGVLGLVDDKLDLPVKSRLLTQLILALVSVGAVMSQPTLSRGTVAEELVWLVAYAACVVAYTNAFNFMDGVNGISALSAIAAGAYLSALSVAAGHDALAVSAAVLTAAAAGFLPWNFPRAKVFLGDGGAYALGAGLSLVAVSLALNGVRWWWCLPPFVVYLADTGFALLKRLLGRRPWYEAHREHVYQQIFDARGGHVPAALLPTAASAAICGAAFAAYLSSSAASIALAAIATAGMTAAYLAVPSCQAQTTPLAQGKLR